MHFDDFKLLCPSSCVSNWQCHQLAKYYYVHLALAFVYLFQNVHYERNMSDITGLELWPFVNGDPINRQIVDSFDCSLYDEFRLRKVHRFT